MAYGSESRRSRGVSLGSGCWLFLDIATLCGDLAEDRDDDDKEGRGGKTNSTSNSLFGFIAPAIIVAFSTYRLLCSLNQGHRSSNSAREHLIRRPSSQRTSKSANSSASRASRPMSRPNPSDPILLPIPVFEVPLPFAYIRAESSEVTRANLGTGG